MSPMRLQINAIVFNLSGPLCIAAFSFFAIGKKVSFQQLSRILSAAALPTLTTALLVFLHRTPSQKSGKAIRDEGFTVTTNSRGLWRSTAFPDWPPC